MAQAKQGWETNWNKCSQSKLLISKKSTSNGYITCDGTKKGVMSKDDELIIKMSLFKANSIDLLNLI